MRFTDGFWQVRPGVDAQYAQEAYDVEADGDTLRAYAPTKRIATRGDTLNRPMLSVTLSSPLEGVVRVRIEHHRGGTPSPGFDLVGAVEGQGVAHADETGGTLTTGGLTARISKGAPWDLTFESGGRVLTSSGHKSVGYITLADGAPVAAEPTGTAGITTTGLAPSRTYVHEQLSLGVGELVYGLGERFGPLVKNGQTVDVWNADGGTSSEQSYKSIPFYLTNRGYGVLVNQPEHVSFEVGSETVERVQFSTAGEAIEYLVFDGPTPKDVLARYTELTGRPARVPAWSYGLWLSTSFTTQYDEETVTRFIEGMRERDLPMSVFHFDCFWMREFTWTDLVWDARVFPDPEGMLRRLHDRGLKVSAWINPYIAQRSVLFEEARQLGHLVKRADGGVWQWDLWQAGMALVDFTSPAATRWFQDKLRGLLDQGVDALKTDFGERIPLDVVWADGTAPEAMHNWYTQLYNQAVFEVLEQHRGEGDAVLFARSATTGGQRMPVHWGGDNSSSFESMAETLRGGLSLAFSGFGFWSHDIGGFEGTPDPEVFKRWVAFGMMSSHSRLHGSTSYRVPWAFDEEAVDVTRRFSHLKLGLMPYLHQVGIEAHETGIPFMRPMQLEFPDDPAVQHLDRQYMLGADLLVAPVLSADGRVEYLLPAGTWTNLLTGEVRAGGGWHREVHDVMSMPIWVRAGTVLATTERVDRPDHDHLDGLILTVHPGGTGTRTTTVTSPTTGRRLDVRVVHGQDGVEVTADPDVPLRVRLHGGPLTALTDGKVTLSHV
ncbi:alpha-xylosidase [Clavibacter michiganensis subsp. phaseoli]|jgi:alpha-D-xyloside xylohydrolase|uniref:alpha-D-xyloside xylohydrolase n=1 Tax=Clavibacter phaseoli TaxID=1734031 RepID=A0A8I0V8Q7_9MICO|nr:alpha-xylosidase [Clavibacter phaseoli]MBF4630453.1 alpha-xylosidase [Clavibacter phaseoli]MCJ1710317.1 alpha-xylosidase [Clavibacter phaseoli]